MRKQIRRIQLNLLSMYPRLKLVHPYYDLDQRMKGSDLVKQDLGAVEQTDGVIAIGADIFVPNAEPFNQGGVIEYFRAYQLGHEVYIITNKEYSHPFIKTFATRRFRTLQEFLDWFDRYMEEQK